MTAPQAREALTDERISDLAREAQIAFCLDKFASFEMALARAVEAAVIAALDERPQAEPVVHAALFAIANELHGSFDEQTYEEKRRAEFDLPDDSELSVTITVKQERALSNAIIAVEKLAGLQQRDTQVDDLAMLVRRLVRSVRNAAPEQAIAEQAMDYLRRNGLDGSPLRASPVQQPKPSGEPARGGGHAPSTEPVWETPYGGEPQPKQSDEARE